MTKAGRGISDEWVDRMIQSNHFIKVHDFPITTDVFSNVEIKGGVNYFQNYVPNNYCFNYQNFRNHPIQNR